MGQEPRVIVKNPWSVEFTVPILGRRDAAGESPEAVYNVRGGDCRHELPIV